MSELRRLLVAGAVACIGGAIGYLTTPWEGIPLLFWVGAALTWVGLVWASVLPMDAVEASHFATREDPHGAMSATLLVSASVASLGAVALGIIRAANEHGTEKTLLLAYGIAAIISSWFVLHTVFSLRYAALYYQGPDGGIEFNEDDKPIYLDFAYLAFTIGMTYQVSDTNLSTKAIRHTALRHALLSYLLGTVIIAATINLAAGLAK
jgi:uncharacterized membrane protein